MKITIQPVLIWLSVLIISNGLMWSCTVQEEAFETPDVLTEGTPIEVSFGGFANGTQIVNTRAGDENSDRIETLRLLVFDENHRFLYSRKAVIGGVNLSPPSNSTDYLPDRIKEGDPIETFTATLLSSTQKRFVHFIANYDWKDFQQDYFLEGKDSGELIASLLTNKITYWLEIEFDQLEKSRVNGKVFKLLRNNAVISVSYEPTTSANNFDYQGFTIYNAYDKATVAPFRFNEDMTYEFPQFPEQPTVPPGITPTVPQDFTISDKFLFERENQGENPLFLLIKGQLNGKRTGFYKVDMRKFNETTGVSSLYDIVRNFHYKVIISSVTNEGYATEEEAARMPAGNNLFASVELEKYPSVSDGQSTLSVEKIGEIFVKAPTVFETSIYYSNGSDNVQFYPSWESNDEYLGDLQRTPTTDPNSSVITVNIKQLPIDRTLEYSINLVARPDQNSNLNIISRKIVLKLRQPYDFDLSGLKYVNPDKVNFSFFVNEFMPDAVFPFDVIIETSELTPDISTPALNNQMMIESKNGKYYYRYTVRDESFLGTRVQLNFIRNSNASLTLPIIVKSPYYKDAILQP